MLGVSIAAPFPAGDLERREGSLSPLRALCHLVSQAARKFIEGRINQKRTATIPPPPPTPSLSLSLSFPYQKADKPNPPNMAVRVAGRDRAGREPRAAIWPASEK